MLSVISFIFSIESEDKLVLINRNVSGKFIPITRYSDIINKTISKQNNFVCVS